MENNRKYYAAYEICPDCVQIFENEVARDEWVDYRDALSMELNLDEKDADKRFERTPLSEKEALFLIGDDLYDESKYYEPGYCLGQVWVDRSDGVSPIASYLAGIIPFTSDAVFGVR